MIFLYPAYLWGLLAIAIPVVIHLFRFRRYKTVYFSNIAVLKAVKSETKKQSQLKHLLVLISRILMIIMLVLAFARPVIPEQKNNVAQAGKKYVTVYLDNSLSMQVAGDQGMLFSEAVKKTVDIAHAYSAADRFRLITNDFNPARQRFTDMESFLDQVEHSTITPVSRSFSEVRQRIINGYRDIPVDRQVVYTISDFQKSTFDLDQAEPDSAEIWTWVPLQGVNPSNLYIDSCWLTSPSMPLLQTSNLKVLIKNAGRQGLQKIPLKLKIDGVQRALASFSIPPEGKAEVTLSFTNEKAGLHTAELEVTDNPITFDNRFYLSYDIKEKISVLEVYDNQPNKYLGRLFDADSLMNYKKEDFRRINYSSLGDNQLIILNSLPSLSSGLSRQLKELQGKVDFLLIPSKQHPETNRQLAKLFNSAGFNAMDTGRYEVMSLASQHPLLENVFYQKIQATGNKNFDLPSVTSYFPLEADITSDVIMRLDNGSPFMVHQANRGSNIYTLSVPLDAAWTDFVKHPLFVPVIHRMAVVSQRMQDLYYMSGMEKPVSIDYNPSGDQVLRLKNIHTGVESIPAIYRRRGDVEIRPYVSDPGHYELLNDTAILRILSFNSNPEESELSTYTNEQLNAIISERFPGSKMLRQSEGISFNESIRQTADLESLWKWFIWLALGMLAVEVLLLRFLR